MRELKPKRPIPRLGRRAESKRASDEFLDLLNEPDSPSLKDRAVKFLFLLLKAPYGAWQKALNSYRRQSMIIGLGMIVLIVVHAQHAPSDSGNTSATPTSATNKAGAKLQKGSPDFKTLLPDGKNAKELGDWTRVSPPDGNAVYAYADTLEGVPINVSQQPLPKDFKTDTAEHVRSLATDFGAQKHFTLHGSDIYIGTSTKGPQSIIFTKNGLLILIKSTQKISDDSWASYIEKLN